MGSPSCKFEIIHDTLAANENQLSVSELCQIAGVSRSGYYNWLAGAEKRAKKEAQDQEDFQLTLEAYRFRGYNKGIRGINMRLLHLKPPIIMNPKKIRRLMRKYGPFCPIRKANPYRRMAKAMKTGHVSDKLLHREFEAHGPRYVLLTDITYIPLNDGCWWGTAVGEELRSRSRKNVTAGASMIAFLSGWLSRHGCCVQPGGALAQNL